MKWFIFRHLGSFLYINADNERDANLLLLCRRKYDYYYYKLVEIKDTRQECKMYREYYFNKAYIKLKD